MTTVIWLASRAPGSSPGEETTLTVEPAVSTRGFIVSRSNTNNWYCPPSSLTTKVREVDEVTVPVIVLSSLCAD